MMANVDQDLQLWHQSFPLIGRSTSCNVTKCNVNIDANADSHFMSIAFTLQSCPPWSSEIFTRHYFNKMTLSHLMTLVKITLGENNQVYAGQDMFTHSYGFNLLTYKEQNFLQFDDFLPDNYTKFCQLLPDSRFAAFWGQTVLSDVSYPLCCWDRYMGTTSLD